MDNITHTLSGLLIGAALPAEPGDLRALPLKARAAFCAVVTNLPDLDLLFGGGSDPFLALNLHRGITHSFLMAPLWGASIGLLAYLALGRRHRPVELVLLATAAFALHATLDLLTSYGTQVFAPISNQAHALPLLFIFDPLLWALLGAGAVLMWLRSSVTVARGALVAFTGYVALCGAFMLRAEQLAMHEADSRGLARSVLVFPQPLSPTHWKLVVVDDDRYHSAYANVLGLGPRAAPAKDASRLVRVWNAYQPSDALKWTRREQYGADPMMRGFARFAFSREELAEFRRFALLPHLYAVTNRGPDAGCGWFTDLRFEIKGVDNPFTVGMCHGPVAGKLSKSQGWSLETSDAPPAPGR